MKEVLGLALSSLALALMGAVEGPSAWAVLAFLESLFIPVLNGSNQAIWQAKVPLAVQGKVFAARRMIAWCANPLAMLLAGPLADRVFGPRYGQGEGIASCSSSSGAWGCFGGFPATSSPGCGKRKASSPTQGGPSARAVIGPGRKAKGRPSNVASFPPKERGGL